MSETAPQPGLEHGPHQYEAEDFAVNKLAGEFHDAWRQTRLGEDGSFEPRIKTTSDEAWAEAHGTDQVDIANTEYADLPEDWQAENKAAAEVVVGILGETEGKVDLSDKESRNSVGNTIHNAWLERNEWAKGGDLDKPFDELPEDEQAKDIDQMKVALEVLGIEKAPAEGSQAAERLKELVSEMQQKEDIPQDIEVEFGDTTAYDHREWTSDGIRIAVKRDGQLAGTLKTSNRDTRGGKTYTSVEFIADGGSAVVGADRVEDTKTGEVTYSMHGIGYENNPDEEKQAAAEKRFVGLASSIQHEVETRMQK